MIKLTRPPKPAELTSQEEDRLTKEYAEEGKSVWREDYIVETLLTMSKCKCSYCERKVAKGSTTLHIDHFHPKHKYPSEVASWDNLLPACSDCNTKKSTLDTKTEPILNPARDLPRQYLGMKDYRLYGVDVDGIGKRTRDKLKLNDPIHDQRAILGQKILLQVTLFYQELQEYQQNSYLQQLTRERLSIRLITIMNEGKSDKEYSAAVATVLFTNDEFTDICDFFRRFKLWSNEIQALYDMLQENSLV
jgi:5-methylcytosine-specific restriction endonuclease McrA